MKITIDPAWRVNASETIELPFPAALVWSRMRDPAWFLARDPLHRVVTIKNVRGEGEGVKSYVGAKLVLKHRLFGIGPDRVGRVLTWDQGKGYVVSDLSRRGMRVGFPHVCSYRVEPINAERCRLILGARGKWTATLVPRWVVRVWLWWALHATRAAILIDLVRQPAMAQ